MGTEVFTQNNGRLTDTIKHFKKRTPSQQTTFLLHFTVQYTIQYIQWANKL